MANYALIINIFVAIGTISLALVAFLSLKENSKFMKIQADELKKQNMPVISIKGFFFKGNKIILSLVNVGTTHIRWPVLYTTAYAVESTPLTKTPEGHVRVTKQNENDQEETHTDYTYFHGNIIYKEKKVSIYNSATFLDPLNKNEIDMFSGKELGYSVEPIFLIGNEKSKRKSLPTHWFPPKEFIEFMNSSSLKAVYLGFEICGKDAIDNTLRPISFASFVFDIRLHKTFEEAYKDNFKVSFLPINFDENSEMKFMERQWYEDIKTHHS